MTLGASWVKIHDAFYDHPKWVAADLAEVGLWTALIAWSNRNRTDGLVPRGLPARYGAGPELVAGMVAREILEEDGDQLRIHDYLEWQSSAEQIQTRREKDRHRKRAGDGPDSGDPPDGFRPDSGPVPDRKEGRTKNEEQTRIFDAEFEAWWKPWPVKKDKAEARSRYRARRRGGVAHEDLVRARDHYLAQVDDPRYCKHGATFLGPETWQEWLDAAPETVASVHRLGYDPDQLSRSGS